MIKSNSLIGLGITFAVALYAFTVKPKDVFTKPIINTDSSEIMKALSNSWYVIGYSSLPVSMYSTEEERQFLRKSIFISQKLAVVFNDTCTSPIYSVKKVNTDLFLRRYRTDKNEIEIKADTVYVISLRCNDTPRYFSSNSVEFNYSFIYDGSKIHFLYNGDIFHLERQLTNKE